MSKFDRAAIREWAFARSQTHPVKVVRVWGTDIDVAQDKQATPEMVLANALFCYEQQSLPDLSARDARERLAEIMWDGAGKGYVQMTLDELLDEALAIIAQRREWGDVFISDLTEEELKLSHEELKANDRLVDWFSLDDLFASDD